MFWAGDVLKYISGTYGEDHARAAAKSFSDESLALESWAIARGLDPERPKLSWQHYRAARQETGCAASANTWLKIASEQGWTVPVMRQAIRSNTEGIQKTDSGRR